MLGGQEALEKPPRWSKENFLEEDSDANLIIENGVIKAASFPKLVSKLTMDAGSHRIAACLTSQTHHF